MDMKKTFLVLTIIFSLGALSACGGGNAEGNSSAQTEAALVNDIEVDEFKSLKEEKPGIILDVRTPGETSSGIVEGALLIDITQSDFMDKISKLDKTKPIYVYCKVGGRSSNASQKLVDLGYTQVYNVMGGMDTWKSKGYPTVTP
jgi:rhodanese-related sulfurtransferase